MLVSPILVQSLRCTYVQLPNNKQYVPIVWNSRPSRLTSTGATPTATQLSPSHSPLRHPSRPAGWRGPSIQRRTAAWLERKRSSALEILAATSPRRPTTLASSMVEAVLRCLGPKRPLCRRKHQGQDETAGGFGAH
ncbi:hypothetical protein PanWU01x14_044430 [Parasponia andersonii]|uniref:Uncharacterized protein n=1 Tax=Parasponia andersonii TaxID=3476 RepID=A0A2P5DP69_PARAD|nr:hypothetical protein PanWU01x14_044430 [Parasponia andersonii]